MTSNSQLGRETIFTDGTKQKKMMNTPAKATTLDRADGPRGCIGEARMREPIDKVLAIHIQRQAGHLKLTADDSERLKAMLAHIGNQDHILTTYTETEKGQ